MPTAVDRSQQMLRVERGRCGIFTSPLEKYLLIFGAAAARAGYNRGAGLSMASSSRWGYCCYIHTSLRRSVVARGCSRRVAKHGLWWHAILKIVGVDWLPAVRRGARARSRGQKKRERQGPRPRHKDARSPNIGLLAMTSGWCASGTNDVTARALNTQAAPAWPQRRK